MSESTDLARRGYYVSDEVPGKPRPKIEVTVTIDGRRHSHVSLETAGLVAVVMVEGEPGFGIEIVKPGGLRMTEDSSPEVMSSQRLLPWQRAALKLHEG